METWKADDVLMFSLHFFLLLFLYLLPGREDKLYKGFNFSWFTINIRLVQ